MKISSSKESGLTILEILVALAIISIVSVIAVPNVSSWTKSRIVKKELAYLETMIDYAKAASVTKSRRMYLVQTGTSAIQLFQHRTGTDAFDSVNLNNVRNSCSFGTSATEPTPEFSNVTSFESTIKAKHNNSSPPSAGSIGNYPNTTSLMCFFSNGTTTGGGFEVEKDCFEYRIDVWLTGFYAKQINTKTSCTGTDSWIERN